MRARPPLHRPVIADLTAASYADLRGTSANTAEFWPVGHRLECEKLALVALTCHLRRSFGHRRSSRRTRDGVAGLPDFGDRVPDPQPASPQQRNHQHFAARWTALPRLERVLREGGYCVSGSRHPAPDLAGGDVARFRRFHLRRLATGGQRLGSRSDRVDAPLLGSHVRECSRPTIAARVPLTRLPRSAFRCRRLSPRLPRTDLA